MTNSVDQDQLASEEANWSGSTQFAKAEHVVFSKRRVNTNTHFLFWLVKVVTFTDDILL